MVTQKEKQKPVKRKTEDALEKELDLLLILLNDDDQDVIAEIQKKIISLPGNVVAYLEEQKYFAKNQAHFAAIEQAIHGLKTNAVKQIIQKTVRQQKQFSAQHIVECLLDLAHVYCVDDTDYFTIEKFHRYQQQVKNRTEFFMNFEDNPLKALSIFHCLLMVDLNLKTLAEYGVVSLEPQRIGIPLNQDTILRYVQVPDNYFFKILEEGQRIKITGLPESNKEINFQHFFFNHLFNQRTLHYLPYLLLMKNLMSNDTNSHQEAHIVGVEFLQQEEHKINTQAKANNLFLYIKDKTNPAKNYLYYPHKHEIVAIVPFQQQKKKLANNIQLHVFERDLDAKIPQPFFIQPITNIDFLYTFFLSIKRFIPKAYQAEFETYIQLCHC